MSHQPLPIDPPRKLTPEKSRILDYLLSVDFPGREELRRQFQSVRVSEECSCCRSITLLVDKIPENVAPVIRRIPIEAQTAMDENGSMVHTLLHVVNGFMDELEIYRDDLEMMKQLPEINAFELINLDE